MTMKPYFLNIVKYTFTVYAMVALIPRKTTSSLTGMTDSGQMASFMQSHRRKKVRETDREEVPTRQLVAMFTSHPHPLLGRANAPHGALCTAAGTDVTHDAIFLPAG